MESVGNVRKITVELPTYPSHKAPHIHSMELLTYTWSIVHNTWVDTKSQVTVPTPKSCMCGASIAYRILKANPT